MRGVYPRKVGLAWQGSRRTGNGKESAQKRNGTLRYRGGAPATQSLWARTKNKADRGRARPGTDQNSVEWPNREKRTLIVFVGDAHLPRIGGIKRNKLLKKIGMDFLQTRGGLLYESLDVKGLQGLWSGGGRGAYQDSRQKWHRVTGRYRYVVPRVAWLPAETKRSGYQCKQSPP